MKLFLLALLGINFNAILGKSLYIGMLLLLFIASLGVPLPEDVPLLLGGAVARFQDKPLIYVFIVGLIGVMSGDIVLYTAGRKFGMDVLKLRPFRALFTPTHIAHVKYQFKIRGNWIIFFGRFFAGIRSVMCVTAGLCKVPAWKFVLIDLTGAVLSVPLLITIGWWFSGNITKIIKNVATVERIVGAIVVIVIVSVVTYIHLSKRSKLKRVERDAKQDIMSDEPAPELDCNSNGKASHEPDRNSTLQS